MHYIIAAFGSSGDINPLLAVGADLKRIGHEVTFIANPIFGQHARMAGLTFAPVGTEADFYAFAHSYPKWWEIGSTIRSMMLLNLAPVYACIASLLEPGKTVLVANHLALGAFIAAEKFRLPLVTIIPTPSLLRTVYEAPTYTAVPILGGKLGKACLFRCLDFYFGCYLTKPVNDFRKTVGLRPGLYHFFNWIHSSNLMIGVWPDWFAKVQPDWPPQLVLSGFLNYDRSEHQSPNSIQSVAARDSAVRPVVMTVGSQVMDAEVFFNVALQASQSMGRPFIVTAANKPQRPINSTDGVQFLQYAPFSRLLPTAAAMINHGGIGSISAAIAAGVPQIIIALHHDQYDNAARAEKLGVAVLLSKSRLTPERLVGCLNELLQSRAVSEQCRYWKQRLDGAAARQRVCHWIENIHHEPLRSEPTLADLPARCEKF